MLVAVGCFITTVFIAIAFFSAVLTRDKAKGIGTAIMLWLFFTMLFDGILLFLLFQFSDYPIEQAMLIINMFSPVDIARILILLQMDVSALLGYTGAIFRQFFGNSVGIIISFVVLTLWTILPFWASLKNFKKKDL
jgi:Cu-processing system permease protein